ncbi:hypothetical protein M404DRAFT_27156 [Pisolithus tinctorius Marx 270]|uniref:F-box domain-containing protein n=1 Tax=Pisolithus tinctorius Marx 270 TaxID=870435 RepID=A0A0C3P7D1_PISTI|nr:hypothetical protein M404DRAFT_27156 [Pisolithus tinctorius Marx 270]
MEDLYDTPTSSPVTLSEEFHCMLAVADAEELDQMLQRLRSAIVYTSQWRNSFALAVRLPGDVLYLIFEHATPDRDTHMLRTLSQVCRRWRSIILQAPLLWRKAFNIADGSIWFSEVLRRTQIVPLEVFFDIAEDYTGYAIPNLTTILIDDFRRCASLHIEGYGDDIEEILSSNITTNEVPFMRCLSIHNISSPHNGEVEIPDSILSILAPRLISLHLEGCKFNWDVVRTRLAPHSPLLSSLRIRNFHFQSPATVWQLLSVLESLPNLKECRLQNSFIGGEMDWTAYLRKVHLPHLASLVFESSTAAGAKLLAALELPSLSKLEAVVDVGRLATDVHQFMEGVQLATCRMERLPFLYIHYAHGRLIFQSNHYHRFPRLQVTFRNWALRNPTISDNHLVDLIRGIADVAALQRTQELKVSLPISIEQYLAPDAWAYFLRRLKEISLISFGTHTPLFLIRTLFLDARHSYDNMEVQSRLLPSLEQICLPSIPELEVLIHILADARSQIGTPLTISTISRNRPRISRREVQSIEVVHEMMLEWLTNLVVHSAPGDSMWLVDDESDESDEFDELSDEIDNE